MRKSMYISFSFIYFGGGEVEFLKHVVDHRCDRVRHINLTPMISKIVMVQIIDVYILESINTLTGISNLKSFAKTSLSKKDTK